LPTTIIDTLLGTKAAVQQQQTISAGEAHALSMALTYRYTIRELNDVFENFAHDTEWKVILALGKRTLDAEIAKIEAEMDTLGIPLPARPPKSVNTPGNTEAFRDELMYRTVQMGVENLLDDIMRGLRIFRNRRLRRLFLDFLENELGLYTKLADYGGLKGWITVLPNYNPGQS
jgi:hypothetical protein